MSNIPYNFEMEDYIIAKVVYLNILDFKTPEKSIKKYSCL